MDNNEKLTNLYVVVLLPLLSFVSAASAVALFVYEMNAPALSMFLISMVTFGMIVRRHFDYVSKIKHKAASSETAERFRAELAETHVVELEHYVAELERSSRLLGESRELFRHAALHDGLTGLANRSRFAELVTERLKNKDQGNFAIIYVDLNRFKTVNDSLGHAVGDHLIREVASRLVDFTGEKGTVGRFSGDDFAILLDEADETEVAERFAEKLETAISEPFQLNERQIFTSASIGIAVADVRYQSAEEMLRDADIAMYYAKETQKGFVVFDTIMHARAVMLLELETDLRLALDRGEFELFYQPLVNLDTVGLMGFEALVRWNHPNRGLVTPDEFISVAESTGIIIPMTAIVLRSACEQLVSWQASGKAEKNVLMSVNLSPGYLARRGVVDEIRSIIFETGIEPECLKLEITEAAVMESPETIVHVLTKIKALGLRISIDDFGTGYSNLSYLHRFPIDTLKIDRSFVGTMEEGSEAGEIVRTVIALAKTLKLSVIAEGIESIHQFHQLRILGCEYGQGYLFSRPLPAGEIERLLADQNRWRNILPNIDFGAVARNYEFTHMRVQ